MGDAERLQQVVWNLLSNAIKFTPNGGRIEVRLRTRADQVDLEVTDSGKGIAPEFLPYVFDRFRQADSSSTRTHGGLGLGLAIVRHLVELHGGSVKAGSGGEGQGSTFAISLPVAGPAAEAGDIAPVPAATVSRRLGDRAAHPRWAARAGGRRRGRRARPHRGDPARAGAPPRTPPRRPRRRCRRPSANGRTSWSATSACPTPTGTSSSAELRRREPAAGHALPAVALTAYARSQDRERALAAGFQRHLAKPVEPDDLILAVAELAGRTAQHTEGELTAAGERGDG